MWLHIWNGVQSFYLRCIRRIATTYTTYDSRYLVFPDSFSHVWDISTLCIKSNLLWATNPSPLLNKSNDRWQKRAIIDSKEYLLENKKKLFGTLAFTQTPPKCYDKFHTLFFAFLVFLIIVFYAFMFPFPTFANTSIIFNHISADKSAITSLCKSQILFRKPWNCPQFIRFLILIYKIFPYYRGTNFLPLSQQKKWTGVT